MKRQFSLIFLFILSFSCSITSVSAANHKNDRPNIFFAIADDWGWPHSSIYGDAVIKTPTFDSIAANGVLFTNAFISAPSCTPSRNAILTGQYHWRLKSGGNLWSNYPEGFPTYVQTLKEAGYFVGSYRKAFGPGSDGGKEVAGKSMRAWISSSSSGLKINRSVSGLELPILIVPTSGSRVFVPA